MSDIAENEVMDETVESAFEASLWLSSGNQSFDALLGHGIRRGCVTEVSGPRGSGKTRLAILLSCCALRANSEVIYIDTECGVTPDRIAHAEPTISSQLHRIRYFQPCSAAEVLGLAYCLEAKLIDASNVALLVLDSLASVIRGEFVSTRFLARLGLLLQKLACTANTAVLILNHVSLRGQNALGARQVPSIERTWASSCTARIQLLGNDKFIVWKGLRRNQRPRLPTQIIPKNVSTDDGVGGRETCCTHSANHEDPSLNASAGTFDTDHE